MSTACFCSECGAPIVAGSLFCSRCGTPVPASEPVATVEAPAVMTEDSSDETVFLDDPAPASVTAPTAPTSAPAAPAASAPAAPAAAPAPAEKPKKTKKVKAEKPPKAEKPKKEKTSGVSIVLTFLLCILLIPCFMLLIVLLLIRSLFPDTGLPAVDGLDISVLSNLANELYPLITGSVLITLFLILIIFLNRGRFRRFFLAIGLSSLILSLLVSLGGVFASVYVTPFQLDSEMTHQYIVYFREVGLVIATVCTAVGLLFTIIYLCIAAVKKNEA